MDIKFKWDKPEMKIIEEATGGSAGALFLANEAKRLMDPYVPAVNMMLSQEVQVFTEKNEGIVKYLSPYAHYQYEGILYVSSKTGSAFSHGEYKIPTDRKLKHSTFRHPLATSHWDKAMLTARKSDLAAAYQAYLNRGAK